MIETEQPTHNVQKRKHVTLRMMFLTVLFSNILTVAAGLFLYDRLWAIKILVYNLEAKLVMIDKAVADGKITAQQAEQLHNVEIEEARKISEMVPANYIVLSGGSVLGSHAKVIDQ